MCHFPSSQLERAGLKLDAQAVKPCPGTFCGARSPGIRRSCARRFWEPTSSPAAFAHAVQDANSSLDDSHAFASSSHLSSIHAAIASSAAR